MPSHFIEHTQILARELVMANATIVYGGGADGLMGCLADTAIAHGGRVIGILPEFMVRAEWEHKGICQMVVVKDMGERKRLMIEDADAVVALPGGCGTLEELMEVFTLKQLGLFCKPIVVLNTCGFYHHLAKQIDHMVETQFMHPENHNLWQMVENPYDVIPAINNPRPWRQVVKL